MKTLHLEDIIMQEAPKPGTLRIRGVAVSPGIASGKVFSLPTLKEELDPLSHIAPAQIPAELQRLELAFEDAIAELRALREIADNNDLGCVTHDILSAHEMLLQDSSLRKSIQQRICNQLFPAQRAVNEAVQAVINVTCTATAFWRARQTDFEDIRERLISHLNGKASSSETLEVPADCILVARDLLPCQMIALAQDRVKAVVTEEGSPTSHVTIIARSWGVPAVVGATDICSEVESGETLRVDGFTGQIERLSDGQKEHPVALAATDCDDHGELPDRDDGLLSQICLLGNVNRIDDLPLLKSQKLQGIGLYRTEFFYLHSLMPPNLAQQTRDYSRAAIATAPDETVIRTFDFSREKWPVFWGNRSSQLVESERSCLFNEQLLALLRCYRSCGNVAIMFPMIESVSQLDNYLMRLERIAERIGLDSLPMIGAMIETLPAVEQLPEIIRRVDFLSIGSNDLASQLLGVDRTGATLHDARRWLMEPRLLKVVSHIIDMARESNCPLSLCGEAAGDPILATLFVGLGLRRLSISPLRVREVRRALSRISMQQAQSVASHALKAETLAEVVNSLVHYLPDDVLHIVSNHRWEWYPDSNASRRNRNMSTPTAPASNVSTSVLSKEQF